MSLLTDVLTGTLAFAGSHAGGIIAAAAVGYFGFRIAHDIRNSPRIAAAELRCVEAQAAISFGTSALPADEGRKFMNTFLHGDPRMVEHLWPDWPDWRDRYVAIELDTRL